MTYFLDRRRDRFGFAGAHARQDPAERHVGRYMDFLSRHEVEAQQAAQSGNKQRTMFAACLLERAGDSRNVMCAIEHCAQAGQATGPSGLRLAELADPERWDLARHLGKLIRTGEYTPGRCRSIAISKGANRGTRTISIQDQEDRVVERSVLQIIRPILEAQYLDNSFGYRPQRGREQALAYAEAQARIRDRWCWITEDLRDAFDHVPQARLIQILQSMIPAPDLCEFVARLTKQGNGRGIRQGGPLSPELLNVYLHRSLDQWWRTAIPDSPLIRVADDILILSQEGDVERQYERLAQQVRSLGMQLKHNVGTALSNVGRGQPAVWLGYRIYRNGQRFGIQLQDRSWDRLAEHLELAHAGTWPALTAKKVISGWVAQQGAAYSEELADNFYARISETAQRAGFDEIPSAAETHMEWHRASLRWVRIRRRTNVCVGRSCAADGSADQLRNYLCPSIMSMDICDSIQSARGTPIRREVCLYCEGAFQNDSGIGGWGWLQFEMATDLTSSNSGFDAHTSKIRMELQAVIQGLRALSEPSRVRLWVVSEPVFLGITKRLKHWIEAGRCHSSSWRPVENRRLWRQLIDQLIRHDVICLLVQNGVGNFRSQEARQLAHAALHQAAAEHAEPLEGSHRVRPPGTRS